MADKVLNLFWNLAHSNDVANDIMDQALSAHIKILDYRYNNHSVLSAFYMLKKLSTGPLHGERAYFRASEYILFEILD